MKVLKRSMQIIGTLLLVTYLGWAWVANTSDSGSGSTSDDVIKIGTEGTYEPFTYYNSDNQLVGFDVDVARAVFKKLNRKIEFVDAPWDSMLAAFNSGKTDAVFNQAGITPERTKKYAMSIPYSYSRASLITNQSNQEIRSFSDLKGKKSAQTLTSNYADMAKKLGATIVSTDTFNKAVDLLTENRADATLNDDVVFYSFLRHKPDAKIKIVARDKKGIGSGAMFNKSNKKLAKQVSEAIEELRKDGTLTKISKKYFDKDITQLKE